MDCGGDAGGGWIPAGPADWQAFARGARVFAVIGALAAPWVIGACLAWLR